MQKYFRGKSKKLSSFVGVAFLVGTIGLFLAHLMLIGPQQKQAHASGSPGFDETCSRDESCTGKDHEYTLGPDGQACEADDRPQPNSHPIPGGTLYEIYSANCGTTWGRIVEDVNSGTDNGTAYANVKITRLSDGKIEQNSGFANPDRYSYPHELFTKLLFSDNIQVQVCGHIGQNNQDVCLDPE